MGKCRYLVVREDPNPKGIRGRKVADSSHWVHRNMLILMDIRAHTAHLGTGAIAIVAVSTWSASPCQICISVNL
jgi:hypothetical protein